MLIGIRGHDLGQMRPGPLAEAYAEKGIETVQLAVHKTVPGINSYADVDEALLGEIRREFKAHNIGIAVLGCYIEPSLPDEAARKAQVAHFIEGIRCAEALGAGCIASETTSFTLPESERPAIFDKLCLSLETMLAEAEKRNATVSIEPVESHTLCDTSWVKKLRSRFDGSGLHYIFDPINLLVPDRIGTQNEIWQDAIEVFGGLVTAMHIKDSVVTDGRLTPTPLGTGVMDYETTIVPWLKSQRPDMPLLREEIAPATADQDLAYMRRVFL